MKKTIPLRYVKLERHITKNDVGVLRTINPNLRPDISNQPLSYLIAYKGEEPVGYILYRVSKGDSPFETCQTHVRKGYLRKGIATKMTYHLLGHARTKYGAAVKIPDQNSEMRSLVEKMERKRRMHYGSNKSKPDGPVEHFDWFNLNRAVKITHRKLK
ncbi:MAG: GNAT family N-acetyltransferase [Candidatus Diapherotrites archaeon]